jgi:hypothetical protein
MTRDTSRGLAGQGCSGVPSGAARAGVFFHEADSSHSGANGEDDPAPPTPARQTVERAPPP